MEFKDYIRESIITYAFWITPKGQIVGDLQSHISMVIKAPEKFGLTREYIDKVYKKYNETIGMENKGREEIIRGILEDGFIRIRKYKNDDWVINIHKISKKNKKLITKWAEKITEQGVDGIKARPTETARITDMISYNKRMSLGKLATGALLFETLSKDFDLIECSSVFELDDIDLIV